MNPALRSTGEPADLVIIGARVRIGPGDFAAAIGITGDRITSIGDSEDVLALRRPGARVVEAPGGLVLPGFQDAHNHAPMAGRTRRRIWLNDEPDRAGYLAAIARYAATHPAESWLIGGGWAMAQFPGGLPRREDLDAIVPDRPVFLFNRDVHGAWVNSRALELAGITRDSPDPSDGRIERDPDGQPTGMLHEGAAYSFSDRVLPVPDRAEWEQGILEAQHYLHALGITGWQDAWVTPGSLAAYSSLAADGRLTARVVGALWWDRHRGLEQIDGLLAQREASTGIESPGGAGFHPTTVKIMTDGVLENYSGALLEPYCDGCGGHTDNAGISFVAPELLAEAVTRLDALRFQVHLHAIGDRAVRQSLDAVAAARAANGPSDNRHHIAHVQVVHPNDIKRFAELGVTANCQTYWAQSDEQMDELTIPFLGDERAGWQYPFESIRRAGGHLAMGSDWAVSTPNPLTQIEVAITRTDPSARSGPAFLPNERLSLDVAVDAFTAGSAWVNHDAAGGAIGLGRRADLALLDLDVFAPGFSGDSGAPVNDASVMLTVASGRVVHER